MLRRSASLAALAAALLSPPAPARPPGGGGHGHGHGFGGGRPGFAPSYRPSHAPARTVTPSGRHSFYYRPGLPSRTAVSFSLRLAQNPTLARNLYFFGRSSPFGLSGGWLRSTPYGYPWFSFGYGLGYRSLIGYVPGATAYSPQYAPPTPYPGTGVPPEEEPPSEALGRAVAYAQQGEIDFRNGRYDQAVRDWQHALVDSPSNAGLVLLLAQALFQTGNFVEAAGAVQRGLSMLPQDQWGVVVGKYARLYGTTGDYTAGLRTLEKARTDNPKDPALRFLLGYHYAHLGYPRETVRELDELLKVAPGDALARKIRDAAAARIKPQP